jgi:hypothetical protein
MKSQTSEVKKKDTQKEVREGGVMERSRNGKMTLIYLDLCFHVRTYTLHFS